jgi:hypothetical protein
VRAAVSRAAVLVASAAVLAACTSAPPPAALPPVERTDLPTAAPAATAVAPDDEHSAQPDPATDRTTSTARGSSPVTVRAARPTAAAAAGVYDAYLRWLRAYLGAFAAPDIRTDPLAAVAGPSIRAGVRAQLARLAAQGYAEYGPVTVAPRVVALAPGRTARVQSCLDLSHVAMRDAYGRLDYYESRKLAITAFTWSNGRWMVTGDDKRSVARC